MIRFKRIPGFDNYKAGTDGSVWTCHDSRCLSLSQEGKWKKLKQTVTKGRKRVGLYRNKKRFNGSVQRIILLTFVGPCPQGMEARHLNSVPSDCRLSNLEWNTKKVNQGDRVGNRTDLRGEKTPLAKLTWKAVTQIRRLYRKGLSYSKLSEMFSIHFTQVAHIIKNRQWKEEWRPTN